MEYMKLNEVYAEAANQRRKFAIACIDTYLSTDDTQQDMIAEHLRTLYDMYDQAIGNVVDATETLTEGAEQIQGLLALYEES